ncbi:MAG TPA: response regulator [Burkholderiaceae bacterium]|nr:response regulator [Burkholderiaceae bacterium]
MAAEGLLRRHLLIYVLIAAGVLTSFAVDLMTPLGVSYWVLYLVPVALCLLQPQVGLPVGTASVCSLLVAIGLFVSPPGSVSFVVATLNRAAGLAALWVMAMVVRRILLSRGGEQQALWRQRGAAEVAQAVVGEKTVHEVAEGATGALARYVGAHVGVLYRMEAGRLLETGGYALPPGHASGRVMALGEGVAGEVAREKGVRWVRDLPAGYLPVSSTLGSTDTQSVLIFAVTADARLVGLIELGFLGPVREPDLVAELAGSLQEPLGQALRSAIYRQQLVELLEQTQRQSEELQAQQEELRVANEELEQQARALQESQTALEEQQAQLEQTNTQLEERTHELERQKQELVVAQQALRLNATRLEAASRHKSEFLANMSHELRTPLNSALILAKLLADNREGTLTEEQVKYARSIHAANSDLLALINDILDLSKIEAGRIEIQAEPVSVDTIVRNLKATFDPIAQTKGLAFNVRRAARVPATLLTDEMRLMQVLKNLLSNAFKFTEQGEVEVSILPAGAGRVAFAVRDTGVGIAPEQQEVIFEAFRQADGSTSRKYGGTGLGLSISRELAHRLGGRITVDSAPGRGSTFTLELPLAWQPLPGTSPAPEPSAPAEALVAERREPGTATRPAPAATAPAQAGDDRDRLTRRHRLILVVEDDEHFARVLYDLAHEMDFDCVIAATGAEAVELARDLQPTGVLLDIGLPDQSGLGVLEQLKRDPSTRHIPVHVVSLHDKTRTALELGAIGYVLKPVDRERLVQAVRRIEEQLRKEVRRVLVVEDDQGLRESIALLLAPTQADITTVGTVREALECLSTHTYDCMVMDLALPDGSGYELLERLGPGTEHSFPPVIVYTGRVMSPEEEQRLRKYSRSIIIKGARSPERLLDEVTLFLHSVESSLPADQQRLLQQVRQRDAVLEGKRVLLVEDDIRNVFALSSALEPLGIRLEIARNGREALDRLQRGPMVDLVLMDIMMPEMDGLTATREIRARPELAKLPIIALTAKAMADDRTRCIEAGADDYVAKPIDLDRLISLCRVWIRK